MLLARAHEFGPYAPFSFHITFFVAMPCLDDKRGDSIQLRDNVWSVPSLAHRWWSEHLDTFYEQLRIQFPML